jgi:hypothetical protein
LLLRAEFDAGRAQSAADLARLEDDLRRLLMGALAKLDKAKRGAAGTALACLLCGERVPETSDALDDATAHRKLLPKLGAPQAWREDVYRGGFKMPGPGGPRPNSTPGMAPLYDTSGGVAGGGISAPYGDGGGHRPGTTGGARMMGHAASAPQFGGGGDAMMGGGGGARSVDMTMTSNGIGGRFPTAKAARTNAMLNFRQNGSPIKAPAGSALDGGNGLATSSVASWSASARQRGSSSKRVMTPGIPQVGGQTSSARQPLGALGQPGRRPGSAPSSPTKRPQQ